MSDTVVKRQKVREVEGATYYSDGTILLMDVRLSYPHLDKPQKSQDGKGEPSYSLTALIPKDRVAVAKLVRAVIKKTIKDANIPDLVDLPPTKKFLHDGDVDHPDKSEYAGHWSVSARERPANPPKLRGKGVDPKTRKRIVVTPEQAGGVFYAGAWANVLIRPWFQNNEFGKRVNANLCAVMFVRDDEPFGKGRLSDDDIDESFGPIGDDDSGFEDDLDDDI